MVRALHLVQVSDTHLFAEPTGKLLGLVTADSFQSVLSTVQALAPAPDLLILTGDLAQDHQAKTYQYLRTLMASLTTPIYWLAGNHDQPELMVQELSHPPFNGIKAFQAGGWQFILLSSHLPGHVHGHLSQETLTDLSTQLQQASDRPTLVALHHPPFLVGSQWLDGSRLDNPEDLFAVLALFPQVKLVLFGHIHQEFQQERQGITYLGTPSTCIQFLPASQEFGLEPVGPGFRQVWLYPDGAWETKVTRVDFSTQVDATATGY
ncbi:3',5'-cyclic-AMP phosphodiesterase [Thermosynechococcaceae cyanobacterium BACA0444]|uniref:3',5'-cyclic-AMP phosphodiesterase n=1 Tax=Pseudocalidococcus azoricus BACA0444 TaxID=2918990 RepID=A0AAE4JY30_9CYAN|nr:3',5'-cyclic-AMP phosphodiesterase [Pseudocalidococcus azoricus]MDS3859317.1 3',5'-cyclic-AMP phosphodiesterase [Pseudocalidococcus azoricus BACA0444]